MTLAQQIITIGPVSYTHLDVYKRQVHHLIPFYFILIQYKVNLNLTSTKFIFFIHAKSSLYNRLLDIAKTAFQKQLTSKSVSYTHLLHLPWLLLSYRTRLKHC